MNIDAALEELRIERENIEAAIVALERLQGLQFPARGGPRNEADVVGSSGTGRRGRRAQRTGRKTAAPNVK